MSDKYWEIVEYECQDGKCLMIHNIPKDSKLGALSLDHRDIGEAIVDKLNEQQDQISYWKHKVYSLLWILGQFDKAKVEKLLKEIDDE